jgi:hypothetical protein
MNIYLRNTLAVIGGLVAGSIVNMLFVLVGSMLIAPPPSVDVTNADSIKASMHLFEPKHFVVPFVAHAAGALVGGLVASLAGGSRRFLLSMIVGGFFVLGGISAAFMIPAPSWFIAVDLLFAYIPMAWFGWKLSGRG